MKLRTPSLALALAIAFGAAQAQAALSLVSSIGGQPSAGVNYINFDALPLGSAGGSLGGGVSLVLAGNAQVVVGAASGQYAAPFLSNSNGVLFGDNTVSGADATQYVTSGRTSNGGAATLQFSSPQQYLGLLWGSVDNYNSLEFFSGNVSVGLLTGSDITPQATGDQGANGTFYVNINSTVAFDKVVAKSTSFAFEFDNVAYGSRQIGIVPEATGLAVWGLLGLCGLGAKRFRS